MGNNGVKKHPIGAPKIIVLDYDALVERCKKLRLPHFGYRSAVIHQNGKIEIIYAQ